MPPVSTDETAPGAAPGHRVVRQGWRRRLPKVLIAIGVSLAVLIGLIAVGGSLLIHRLEGAFTHGTLLDPAARTNHGTVQGPMNFLLIGSDYRTWSPSAGQRSDTIIVVHVSKELDHVYLLSIPRDLLVNIPADPSEGFGGNVDKINSAFDIGHGGPEGIRLLSKTLTHLTGAQFDGAAAIQFNGLKKAVDLVGGVNMCVDVTTTSIHTGKTYPVGCRLMNSTDALDYLRQREQYADGDFTRQRHQQQFLKAMLERAGQVGVLTNPIKLDQFVHAVADAMTVDTGNLSMADLAYGLRGVNPDQLTGIKVPSLNDTYNGASVVRMAPAASGLFAALREDKLATWVSQNKQWINPL
jgi:LCP family protein required for cell wall assembly